MAKRDVFEWPITDHARAAIRKRVEEQVGLGLKWSSIKALARDLKTTDVTVGQIMGTAKTKNGTLLPSSKWVRPLCHLVGVPSYDYLPIEDEQQRELLKALQHVRDTRTSAGVSAYVREVAAHGRVKPVDPQEQENPRGQAHPRRAHGSSHGTPER